MLEKFCEPFAGYYLFYPQDDTDRLHCALDEQLRAPSAPGPRSGVGQALADLLRYALRDTRHPRTRSHRPPMIRWSERRGDCVAHSTERNAGAMLVPRPAA